MVYEGATEKEIAEFREGISSSLDFTIQCKSHGWKVHSRLLIAVSGFFSAICGNHFKESIESKVDLQDDDPATVCRFIQWLYVLCFKMDTYQEIYNSSASQFISLMAKLPQEARFKSCGDLCVTRKSPVYLLEINIPMYIFAEKYAISDLQQFSIECFMSCTDDWKEAETEDFVRMFIDFRNQFPEALLEHDIELEAFLATRMAQNLCNKNDFLPGSESWMLSSKDHKHLEISMNSKRWENHVTELIELKETFNKFRETTGWHIDGLEGRLDKMIYEQIQITKKHKSRTSRQDSER